MQSLGPKKDFLNEIRLPKWQMAIFPCKMAELGFLFFASFEVLVEKRGGYIYEYLVLTKFN